MARKEDNYHLGCMFLDCLRSRDPEDIFQIDAATGEEESFGSVLSRSISLARSLQNYGLKPGDVLALSGRNHLDLHIPHYAGLFTGLPVLGLDPSFKFNSIKSIFERCKPKIIFCEQSSAADYRQASEDLGLKSKIVTFSGGECTLKQFVITYDDNESDEKYKCVDFDPDVIFAWLVCTSGTTNLPKAAAFLHRPLSKNLLGFKNTTLTKKQMTLLVSPVQWISNFFVALLPYYSNTIKLQTSRLDNIAHVIEVINKYKPHAVMASPSLLVSIMKHENKCDLTCFAIMLLTGAKIHKKHVLELKSRLSKNALLYEAHGLTETYGPALKPTPFGPINSCGIADSTVPIKLVDPETGKDINEPFVNGELWSKGPCLNEYYNDPETTKNAFSEDGWFKTGDLMYRDEQNYYYFVERLKTLIKYRNYHVYPGELEETIQTLEGVEEVAVTGIPHELDSEHPVAFVVKKLGAHITADDVKRVVAEKLTETNSLRGGVIFIDEIPRTMSGKIWRAKLKELVLECKRE